MTTHYSMDDMANIRVELVWVTPQMARTLRTSCHFDRQRDIEQKNVTRLAYELKNGWFTKGTQIYLGVLPDRSMLILNGNHTLEAIDSSGVSVPLTFTYHKVRDIEEAARIYANFDTQRVRSWTARLKASGADGTVKMATKVLPAVGIIMSDFAPMGESAVRRSTTARINEMNRYATAAELVAEAIAGTPKNTQRLIHRAPVMAVALYTARYQPSAAVEFWSAAAHENMDVGHTTRTFVQYLRDHPVLSTSQWIVQLKATAAAWNAFYEGRDIKYCKPHQVQTLRILGTPWHRGKPQESDVIKEKFSDTAKEYNIAQPQLFETGVNADNKPVVIFSE